MMLLLLTRDYSIRLVDHPEIPPKLYLTDGKRKSYGIEALNKMRIKSFDLVNPIEQATHESVFIYEEELVL